MIKNLIKGAGAGLVKGAVLGVASAPAIAPRATLGALGGAVIGSGGGAVAGGAYGMFKSPEGLEHDTRSGNALAYAVRGAMLGAGMGTGIGTLYGTARAFMPKTGGVKAAYAQGVERGSTRPHDRHGLHPDNLIDEYKKDVEGEGRSYRTARVAGDVRGTVGQITSKAYEATKGFIGPMKASPEDIRVLGATPESVEALKDNQRMSKLFIGASGVGMVGGSAYAALAFTGSFSGQGHPYNAPRGRGYNQQMVDRTRMRIGYEERGMAANPMRYGLRDTNFAYSMSRTNRRSTTPLYANQNQNKFGPGAYGDSGDLVFALHTLRSA